MPADKDGWTVARNVITLSLLDIMEAFLVLNRIVVGHAFKHWRICSGGAELPIDFRETTVALALDLSGILFLFV